MPGWAAGGDFTDAWCTNIASRRSTPIARPVRITSDFLQADTQMLDGHAQLSSQLEFRSRPFAARSFFDQALMGEIAPNVLRFHVEAPELDLFDTFPEEPLNSAK